MSERSPATFPAALGDQIPVAIWRRFLAITVFATVLVSIYVFVENLRITWSCPEMLLRLPYPRLFGESTALRLALSTSAVQVACVVLPTSLCLAATAVLGDGPPVSGVHVASRVLGILFALMLLTTVGRTVMGILIAHGFSMPTPRFGDVIDEQQQIPFQKALIAANINFFAGLTAFVWVLDDMRRARR